MIDHFSFLAPFYDRFIGPADSEKLKKILNLPTDGWILDAGGGTGRVSSLIGDDSGGVVVCDISLPMLKQSLEKNNVSPVNSTVDQLPFADNSFDRIIVVDALHHFQNAQKSIAEFIRVLKPGGRLVIEDFDISTLGVKLLALAEKMLLMGSHFFTPDEIVQMAHSTTSTTQVVRNGKRSMWVVVDKAVVS